MKLQTLAGLALVLGGYNGLMFSTISVLNPQGRKLPTDMVAKHKVYSYDDENRCNIATDVIVIGATPPWQWRNRPISTSCQGLQA